MLLGMHVKIVCMGPRSPLLATCSRKDFFRTANHVYSPNIFGGVGEGSGQNTALSSTNKSRKTWSQAGEWN